MLNEITQGCGVQFILSLSVYFEGGGQLTHRPCVLVSWGFIPVAHPTPSSKGS